MNKIYNDEFIRHLKSVMKNNKVIKMTLECEDKKIPYKRINNVLLSNCGLCGGVVYIHAKFRICENCGHLKNIK